MAKRDGFIFHLENAEDLKDLTLEEQGLIFSAMIQYAQDGVEPNFDDRTLRTAWRPIMRRMKADLEAYDDKCAVNKKNGEKGGRPKKQTVIPANEENTTVIEEEPKNQNENQAVFKENPKNRTVNLGLSENPKKPNSNSNSNSNSNIYIYNTMSGSRAETRLEIIRYLNEKTGKDFRHSTKATVSLIEARLNDGYSLDDFKKVIDNKVAEWKDTDQEQYLRPETLFRPSHFESYLNQRQVRAKPKGNTLSTSMTHTYDMEELRRRAKA